MNDLRQRIATLSAEQRVALERRLEEWTPVTAEPIRRRVDKGPAPLSFGQEGLWLLDRLEPNLSAYNIPLAFHLRGLLDAECLARALSAIEERHEVLRTVFPADGGRPAQIVGPVRRPSLPTVDVDALDKRSREERIREAIEETAWSPFDLSAGPLLRAKLLRLGSEEHVLLVTVHHIVFDGWSSGIFWRELGELYGAFRQGREPSLAALPIQYSDYAVWQRERMPSQIRERDVAYWEERLAGAPAVLELPGRVRPSRQRYRGETAKMEVSGAVVEALRSMGQQEGATLFMTLLAAFQILLARHSGQEDVVVGTPVAGRNRSELEALIGFFVNTLVLRTDVSGDPTFRELLRRVRDTALEAHAHQELPFEALVEVLHPKRDLSRTPIVQVFFNLLNLGDGQLRLPGVKVDRIEIPLRPLFDLTLYASEVADRLQFSAVYNADLFERGYVRDLLEQLAGLLGQVGEAPQQRIGAYSLRTESARRVLPDPEASIPEPETGVVADDVLGWSVRKPSEPAVSQGGRVWSYRDLADRSRAIAEGLRAQGLSAGDVVALGGERSFGLIVGMLGVLRSGGVLLTLDASLPAERRRLMIAQARVRILLLAGPWTQEASENDPGSDLRLIQVDAEGLLPSGANSAPVAAPPPVCPSDPAYVFFTSGTSGVPRAVLGSHKGLSHFLRWQRETFHVGPGDRCAQLVGLSFDVVLRDVFLALTSGATLHLPDRGEDPASSRILSWLGREAISILHTVPSVAQAWLTAPPPDAGRARPRWTFFSGEPLSDGLVRRWVSTLPDAGRIVNLYGATEATLAQCFFVVPESPPGGIQPVGRPLPDTQALILSGNRLCGIGELGEIVLRTPFRSLGYLNAPREQRERFVPNPFRSDEGDLLYRTGDRGRCRPDGLLEVLGRWDDQVKIRGVRVEPAEVAAVLSGHPSVVRCAVVSRTDARGDATLVAYVVGPDKSPETVASLRGHLSGRLPSAMVPSAFVVLERLPLTPNGKLDRAALPLPEPPSGRTDPLRDPPRTPVEKTVATIWTAILGVESVGIYDDFFELGGHSLRATQVMARVTQAFGVELPLRALFEKPTIASLSAAVEASLLDQWQKAARGEVRAAAIASKGESTAAAPVSHAASPAGGRLSFAQERLWVLDRLEPGLSAYNISQAVRLEGPLEIAALERGFDVLEQRHEVLRSVLVTRGEQPKAMIVQPREGVLSVVDLSSLEVPGVREGEAGRLVEEEVRRPFDLSRGPLLRVKLLRLGSEDHVLVVTVHHIVFDGWSSGIFWRELEELYGAFREGRSGSMPELPIQYGDYAVWQRERMSGEVLEREVLYWKERLEGAPAVLELPGSRLRPSRQSFRGAAARMEVVGSVVEALRRLGREEGATLFMTLLAAFQVLLMRESGQEDVVVGTPVAGRNRSELEGLIGFFVNTLVLRTDVSGDPTFRELLGRVREVALGAYAHQELPFEKLVEELNPQRTLSYSPIFQVMAVMQNASEGKIRLPGVSVTPMELETRTSKFDLTAFFTDTGKELLVSFQYATDLYEATAVERMLSHLGVLLEGIVEDPDSRVSRLPLMSEQERQQVLEEWNQTEAPYPKEKTVSELFGEQVERAPEAVAVEMEGKGLTYGQLNERANRLARHLQGRGVGPEVLVGLCVERSVEMVVGLLGILKAGGAYLPLDPGYPRQRLGLMVEDAEPKLVLTHRNLGERLPEGVEQIRLDTDWKEIEKHSSENPPNPATPDNLVYVIYTSGSTGKPKGVEVEHRSFVNHITVAGARWDVRPGERVLQFSSLNFDASAQEIFSTLTRGGTLVLRTEEMIETVATFLERCREWKITVLDLPTAYWHELVSVAAAENLCLPEPLRVLLMGGERALPERLAQWFALTGGRIRLINAYGPTEASIAATMWDREGPLEPLPRIVPIGRPIANVRIYVLDGRLQPVPIGVAGELYLGGACPARGYRKRPELTAERFLRDPFGGPDARIYKTGDRVRFRPDGELEYLGRFDAQVKIRGFRVEPGEIEAVLREISGVSDAVVLAREDTPGQARLVAYVASGRAEAPSVAELRRVLKERLPDYMVPSAFVRIESLPTTRSGKLDTAALPEPEPSRPELDNAYCAPRTPAEETLAEIWRSVLGLDRVGVKDNFFELGGHSLLATQVISRAREKFHVDVPLRDLFINPTIEGLALAITERQVGQFAPEELEGLLAQVKAPGGKTGPEGR